MNRSRFFSACMLGIVVVLSSLGGRTVLAADPIPVDTYVPTYLKLWDSASRTFAESKISSPLLVNVGDTITVGLFFENNEAYQNLPGYSNSYPRFRSWQGLSSYFLSNDDATTGLSGLAWEKSYLNVGVDDSVSSLLFETPYGAYSSWDTIMREETQNGRPVALIDSTNYGSGSHQYFVDHTKFLIGMLKFTVTEDMFNDDCQFSLYNTGDMIWIKEFNDAWSIRNSSTGEPWVLGTFQNAAVPEPGTYAMLCGLGLVGAAWYRRRQRKS